MFVFLELGMVTHTCNSPSIEEAENHFDFKTILGCNETLLLTTKREKMFPNRL